MTSTLYIDIERVLSRNPQQHAFKHVKILWLYVVHFYSLTSPSQSLWVTFCSGEQNMFLLARAELQDPPPPQMVQLDWLDVHTLDRTMVDGIYLEVLHLSRMH